MSSSISAELFVIHFAPNFERERTFSKHPKLYGIHKEMLSGKNLTTVGMIREQLKLVVYKKFEYFNKCTKHHSSKATDLIANVNFCYRYGSNEMQLMIKKKN